MYIYSYYLANPKNIYTRISVAISAHVVHDFPWILMVKGWNAALHVTPSLSP